MPQYQLVKKSSKDENCTVFEFTKWPHLAISAAPLSAEKANILRYQFDLHSIEDLKYQILEMCRKNDNKIIIIDFETLSYLLVASTNLPI